MKTEEKVNIIRDAIKTKFKEINYELKGKFKLLPNGIQYDNILNTKNIDLSDIIPIANLLEINLEINKNSILIYSNNNYRNNLIDKEKLLLSRMFNLIFKSKEYEFLTEDIISKTPYGTKIINIRSKNTYEIEDLISTVNSINNLSKKFKYSYIVSPTIVTFSLTEY